MNSATEHATDKIQTIKFSIHFHYQLWPNNYVLIKMQKPQVCHCPDGQLVSLSLSQAGPNCTHGFDSCSGNVIFYYSQLHTDKIQIENKLPMPQIFHFQLRYQAIVEHFVPIITTTETLLYSI